MVCSPVLLLLQKRKPPRKLEWMWLWWSGPETWSWPTMRELITNSLRPLTNLSWPDLFNLERDGRTPLTWPHSDLFHISFVHMICDPFYNCCPRLSRVDTPGSVSFCIGRLIGPLSFICLDLLDMSPLIRSKEFKWEITLNGWLQQLGTNEICHFTSQVSVFGCSFVAPPVFNTNFPDLHLWAVGCHFVNFFPIICCSVSPHTQTNVFQMSVLKSRTTV